MEHDVEARCNCHAPAVMPTISEIMACIPYLVPGSGDCHLAMLKIWHPWGVPVICLTGIMLDQTDCFDGLL